MKDVSIYKWNKKYNTYNFASLNGLISAFSIWNYTLAAIWQSWWSYGKSIWFSDAVSEFILPFYTPNIYPPTTWHVQKQFYFLLQPIHILNASPVCQKWTTSYFPFWEIENNNNTALDAFTWFYVILNINQPHGKGSRSSS